MLTIKGATMIDEKVLIAEIERRYKEMIGMDVIKT